MRIKEIMFPEKPTQKYTTLMCLQLNSWMTVNSAWTMKPKRKMRRGTAPQNQWCLRRVPGPEHLSGLWHWTVATGAWLAVGSSPTWRPFVIMWNMESRSASAVTLSMRPLPAYWTRRRRRRGEGR
jgi:hypothetical protein